MLKNFFGRIIAKSAHKPESLDAISAQLQQTLTDLKRQHRKLRLRSGLIAGHRHQISADIDNKKIEAQKLAADIQRLLHTSMDTATTASTKNAAEQAAHRAATRLCLVETELEDLQELYEQSESACAHARAQLENSQYQIEANIARYRNFQLRFNQVKLQETMPAAQHMPSPGPDIVGMEHLREAIETRYATNLGHAAIAATAVPSNNNSEMTAGYWKLEHMRRQLHHPPPTTD